MGQNLAPMLLMDTVTIPTSYNLDLLKMLGTSKTKSGKWWFDGDLPWYKVTKNLEQIQDNQYLCASFSRSQRVSSMAFFK